MTLSHQQEYGYQWECKLAERLQQFGNVEHLSQICWTHEFDLKLDGKFVHCKVAKSCKHKAHGKVWRNRYQFNLSMVNRGDYLILICDKYGEPVYFIIPISELTRRSLSITSHPLIYSGWASKYRENWSVLNETR